MIDNGIFEVNRKNIFFVFTQLTHLMSRKIQKDIKENSKRKTKTVFFIYS